MVITSEGVTDKIMSKLIALKLLGPIEGHTQESIRIIIEETIDSDFNILRPRTTNIHPTIQLDDSNRLKVRGDGGFTGKKSKYKIHLMEVGDEIIVDEKYQLSVHVGFNHHIKCHEPEWGYTKTDDGRGEFRFKRIK